MELTVNYNNATLKANLKTNALSTKYTLSNRHVTNLECI